MRVYVRYEPNRSDDLFEGARVRKNLKASLEAVSCQWVSSLLDFPDIIHLLSPLDENLLHDTKASGLKTVVSALYCENDPEASFLLDDGSLREDSRRMLNDADLVLVPNVWAQNLLIKEGVKNRIEILPLGVSLERFKSDSLALKEAFYHYFMVDSGITYALVSGSYEDKDGLSGLESLASLNPNIEFFFFGLSSKAEKTMNIARKLNKESPLNVHYSDIVCDDVYRSGMMSCSFYLSLSYRHPDAIIPLEAMASGKQIFRLGPSFDGDPLSNGKLAICHEDIYLCSEAMAKFIHSKSKPTIIEGRKAAESCSIPTTGRHLLAFYQSLYKEKEND